MTWLKDKRQSSIWIKKDKDKEKKEKKKWKVVHQVLSLTLTPYVLIHMTPYVLIHIESH